MSAEQAVAVAVLWNSRRYTTACIAEILLVPEHQVERIVHNIREERRKRA